MGTGELQEEIKRLLGNLKWSQKRLGREFYYLKHDDDDSAEISRYEERVKKDLSRKSTSPKVLQSYLDLIVQHNEFEKLDIIVPIYQQSGCLSEGMERGMVKISKIISELASE